MPSGDDNNEFVPKRVDMLHLGKHGLRLFAMNIKNSVIRKNQPQSRVRFDGGRGEYSEAVGRGRASSRVRHADQGEVRQRGGHNGNRFAPLADQHDG